MANSPTMTNPAAMTAAGMILGTAAYMSPEQAKGRLVDKRSDVWAFGCVLYEMLTARRAFEGEDVSDTLANILKSEPDWGALSPQLPPAIHTILRRCLAKDRRQRLADISIALFLLNEPTDATTPGALSARSPRPLWRRALPVVVTAVATAVVVFALTAGAMWRLRPSVPSTVMRFTIAIPDGQQWSSVLSSQIAMSPAGTHIVYTANRRLYLRSLSDLEVRPITGADNPANTGR